ncbi:MAG: glycoside hydrolase family 57 protein [Acidobacteriota bacterium]
MPAKIKIALLWHMHQPWYKGAFSGKFELPWVRIHAIKDYYGMVKILEDLPDIKVTFNLVPSLLVQLDEYAQGKKDIWQEVFDIESEKLSREEAGFIVNNFFSVNYDNHIKPYPDYERLYKKKENTGNVKNSDWRNVFNANELRDIQAWSLLTNFDEIYKRENTEIIKLLKKGKNFSEKDKKILSEIELKLLKKIIPLYKKMWGSGQIEISTTPYYHPILPLLIDPQLGRETNPSLPEYDLDFNWKEDAEEHIKQSLDYMEEMFGKRPEGMWPSEGSVSQEVVEIMDRFGIKWTATDEKILHKSKIRAGEDVSYFMPWIVEGKNIKIFFRDNYLSDQIGFFYKNGDQGKNAKDLFDKIISSGKSGDEEIVVPIILDGENAWEYYSGSGRVFLKEFFRLVAESDNAECVTFSEASSSDHGVMEKLAAGSWINGNFNIWIGDEEDRRAWKLIRETKLILENRWKDIPVSDQNEIKEHIKIAQGSDWFWWYGSENHTDDLETFDRLFRENLIKALLIAGEVIPGDLEKPVFFSKRKNGIQIKNPKKYITPVIDGKVSGFFEWMGSGEIDVGNMAGAIYISNPVLKKIHFAFDRENFYLRLDLKEKAEKFLKKGFMFKIELNHGDNKVLIPVPGNNKKIQCSAMEIIECGIPFTLLKFKEGDNFSFRIIVKKRGKIFSVFPPHEQINLKIPEERDYSYYWTL